MTDASISDLGRVVVDPRLRQRYIDVRRDAGRRRLKRLLVLITVALVALVTVIVLRSPILDVDEIEVRGAVMTDAATVRDLLGIDAGDPLLLADLAAASAAVESLPWVEEAQVSRDLPGGIVVRVVEREPVAIVSAGGRAVLVDRTGVVLADAPPSSFPPYVYVIAGDVPPEPGAAFAPELETAIVVAERLRTNPSGAVVAVHPTPSLRLQLAGGGTVEFGDAGSLDAEALDARIEAFRTVHAGVDLSCVASIDLRIPTHPVLTRTPGCS